jgi:hypothetical protein
VLALSKITISILSAAFAVNTKCMRTRLYNCKECSTNHPFLCKTKPISEKPELPQSLFHKQLTKNFTSSAIQKTNPNSERPKTNAYSCLQRTYEQILPFYRGKNKPKTNPISAKSQNERKVCLHKGLRKCIPLEAKKTNPIKPNRKMMAAGYNLKRFSIHNVRGTIAV